MADTRSALLIISANTFDADTVQNHHTYRLWQEAARHFDDVLVVARSSNRRRVKMHYGRVQIALLPRIFAPSISFLLSGWLATPRCFAFRPTAIQAQSPLHTGPLALSLAKMLRVPLIVEVHDEHYMRGLPYPPVVRWVFFRWVRFALGSADLVRVLSREMKRELEETFPAVHREKVRVFPTRVDCNVFGPPKADYSVKHKLRVVNVGALTARKGQLRLIDALGGWTQTPVQLDLVGAGPLAHEIALRGQGSRVQVVQRGQLSPTEVAATLREADVMIHVSNREGLPRCILEAMAVGLPVICVESGYVRELITDGETGVLIDDDAGPTVVGALARVIADEQFRRNIGTAAAIFVRANFEWRVVLDRQFGAYKALHHSARGDGR